MTRTYICDQCGGTFDSGWTEEEARAEADANFGDQLGDNPAVVCDDCYLTMTTILPPDAYLAGRTVAESLDALRDRLEAEEAEHIGNMGEVERLLYTRIQAAYRAALHAEIWAGLRGTSPDPQGAE